MKGNYNDERMMRGADGRYKVGGDTYVKVYQIDAERAQNDEEYLNRMFSRRMGWDHAVEKGMEPKDLKDYKLMWEGYLNIHGDAETAFAVLQDYRPIETSRTMYSLSSGDIIEIDGDLLFVDWFGFKDINCIKEVA